MILIIREPATREQLAHMSDASGGTLVKLAVDVERRVLAGLSSTSGLGSRI